MNITKNKIESLTADNEDNKEILEKFCEKFKWINLTMR